MKSSKVSLTTWNFTNHSSTHNKKNFQDVINIEDITLERIIQKRRGFIASQLLVSHTKNHVEHKICQD